MREQHSSKRCHLATRLWQALLLGRGACSSWAKGITCGSSIRANAGISKHGCGKRRHWHMALAGDWLHWQDALLRGHRGEGRVGDARDEAWDACETLAARVARGEDVAWHPFVCALEALALPILRRQWRRLDRDQRFEEAEDAARSILLKVQEKLQREHYRALRARLAGGVVGTPAAPGAAVEPSSTPRQRGSFAGYIKAILVRATIDYQRVHPHYRRASQAKRTLSRRVKSSDDTERGGWISFVSAHSRIDAARDPVTLMNMVKEMLSYLDEASRVAVGLSLAGAASGTTGGNAEPQVAVYQQIAERLNLWKPPSKSKGLAEPDADAARHLVKHGTLYRRAIELHVQGWSQSEIGEALGVTRRVAQRILKRAKALLRARFAPSDASSDQCSEI